MTPTNDDLSALRDRIVSDIENRCSHPADGALTPDERCAACAAIAIDVWTSVSTGLDRWDAELASLQRMADKCREKDWAEIARLNAELAKLSRVGQLFMEKVAVTREAVSRLDAAIPTGAHQSPSTVEIRDAFDALVSTLDLPKEDL